MRYVPQSLGNSTFFGAGFSGYPVKAILPDAFLMRRNNKGLENAAVSPDGKTAWTMMQVREGRAGVPTDWAGRAAVTAPHWQPCPQQGREQALEKHRERLCTVAKLPVLRSVAARPAACAVCHG